ncbi:hypothetical protein RRM63_000276 [Photobacterium damselae]|nr:hypothetical protein [Photobacterium damselae]
MKDYQMILDKMPDEFTEKMLKDELSNDEPEYSYADLKELKKQASHQFGQVTFFSWNKKRLPQKKSIRQPMTAINLYKE